VNLNAGACEGPVNGQKLANHWKHLHAEHYHGHFLKPFTLKQMAQFKQFSKAVPEPMLVMSTCLQHWIEYVKTCESDMGLYDSPEMPVIGGY
jgi:hypothetical protein